MSNRSAKDIFWKIVCNQTLKRVLLNQSKVTEDNDDFYTVCKTFVDYQQKICGKENLDFNKEGFMIGSPWHGNFDEAEFVFIGPNPGFTPRCLFPRWHPDKAKNNKEFSLGGLSANDKLSYINGCGHGNETLNNFISKSEVFDFLVNRFQETCIAESGEFSLRAWIVNNSLISPKGGIVTFWKEARDIVAEMLDDNDAPSKDRTRNLMKHVLNIDIIPFGSKNISTIDKTSLEYCWKHFTLPLLEQCKAKVFFLMGLDVAGCFTKFLEKPEQEKAKQCFEKEKPYEYLCGKEKRWVVQLPHSSQWLEKGQNKHDAVIVPRTRLLNVLKDKLKKHH